MQLHQAHASKVTVAGVDYRVRRDMALALRIEERFGNLREFIVRLLAETVRVREVLDLYAIVLADQPAAPAAEALQAHLERIGVKQAVADIRDIPSALFVGEEKFMAMVAKEAEKQNPPKAPASSPGAISSQPLPSLDGHHPNSGGPPSTN